MEVAADSPDPLARKDDGRVKRLFGMRRPSRPDRQSWCCWLIKRLEAASNWRPSRGAREYGETWLRRSMMDIRSVLDFDVQILECLDFKLMAYVKRKYLYIALFLAAAN